MLITRRIKRKENSMSTTRFVYTMTQATTKETPFIITTQTSDPKATTLYYDCAFATLEEALLTCREIVKTVIDNGFIEIDTLSYPSHTAYILQPYDGNTEFSVINGYNAHMEEEYNQQILYNNTPGYYPEDDEYPDYDVYPDPEDDAAYPNDEPYSTYSSYDLYEDEYDEYE